MRNQKVYDLPTRLFHGLFASMFVVAFIIGKFVSHRSPYYPYHMLIGLALPVLVFLRLLWGVVGSRYARFASFPLSPAALKGYFSSIAQGTDRTGLGHNPASSWAALLMMGCALIMGGTGVMMALGINKELFKEIHELVAYGFSATAVAHVLGVVRHVWVHRDGLGFTMLDGYKVESSGERPIQSNHPLAAAALIAVMLSTSFLLVANFEPTTRQLKLLGVTLQLGKVKKSSDSH